MSELNKTINFPRLVDCEIETGIAILNHNHINEKEKIIKISLKIDEFEVNNNKMKFYCDHMTASKLNYKLKSSLNQIEQRIKNILEK